MNKPWKYVYLAIFSAFFSRGSNFCLVELEVQKMPTLPCLFSLRPTYFYPPTTIRYIFAHVLKSVRVDIDRWGLKL